MASNNDLVGLCCRQAVGMFGDDKPIFNAAGFSHALRRAAGIEGQIDGKLVAAILCGRDDVEPLSGGSHYAYRELEVR